MIKKKPKKKTNIKPRSKKIRYNLITGNTFLIPRYISLPESWYRRLGSFLWRLL